MFAVTGLFLIFSMVFGGYMLAGGKMGIILHALPFEMMMIGGATVGIFLIANGKSEIRGALRDLPRVFSGPRWAPEDYRELLSLMYTLIRHIKMRGFLSLEPHIEKPNESPLFSKYPKILNDHFAITFVTDTVRMIVMSLDDPIQVEDCMQRQIDKHETEIKARAAAIQNLADSLPALGIVVAVLGIVKTMGSISEPVEVLGGMIGGALVGTFLGVFLAYGFCGPIASKLLHVYEQDGRFYAVIRDCLVASLHGHAAAIAVELARGNIPTVMQPGFHEMEQILEAIPNELNTAAAT
jgi:chemotaxis protein MotA